MLFNAGLLHEQNMAKMRLLTFMGMGVENKEVSFDTMQQELQIGADDVEAFVIDGKTVGYLPAGFYKIKANQLWTENVCKQFTVYVHFIHNTELSLPTDVHSATCFIDFCEMLLITA